MEGFQYPAPFFAAMAFHCLFQKVLLFTVVAVVNDHHLRQFFQQTHSREMIRRMEVELFPFSTGR